MPPPSEKPILLETSPVIISASCNNTSPIDTSDVPLVANVLSGQNVSRRKDLDSLSSWIQEIQEEHKVRELESVTSSYK